MKNERDNIDTSKRTNEMKQKEYSERSDYYPFNQPFLDEYYRMWEARNSKS